MKKIGIVSSFNVLCGNATYSQALVDGIPDRYEACSVVVPTKLQKEYDSIVAKELIKQVKCCDAINVQMELGLYGPTPWKASKFLKKIINNSKKTSITMHRIEEKPINIFRAVYNEIKKMKVKNIIATLVTTAAAKIVFRSYKQIILCGYDNNATFIVHTYREEKRLKQICPDAKVFVHPIIWPDDLAKNRTMQLESKFKEAKPIIGLFGFISPYKNFEQVVDVTLSMGYNLLIAGGIHPASTDYGKRPKNPEDISSFQVSSIIKSLDPASSYIYTSPTDDVLINLIKDVDLVVIPYFETGQSASGIASLAIQYGKRVIFSDTNLVTELIHFLNKRPLIFDVCSDVSLSYAIRDCLNDYGENEITFDEYNFGTNINTYLSSVDFEINPL